jgi:hypothetical protein
VLLRHVVDQLGDENRLAHAGAAEQADFTTARIRLQQVDNFDAGFKRLDGRAKVFKARRRAMIENIASLFTGPRPSNGLPNTSNRRPSVASPTGTEIGAPVSVASMPRTSRR